MTRTIEEAFVAIRPDSRRFLGELEGQLRAALASVERDLRFAPEIDAAGIKKGASALTEIGDAGSDAAVGLADVEAASAEVEAAISDIGDAGSEAVSSLDDLGDGLGNVGDSLSESADAGGLASQSFEEVATTGLAAQGAVGTLSTAVGNAGERIIKFATSSQVAAQSMAQMAAHGGAAGAVIGRLGATAGPIGVALLATAATALVVGRSFTNLANEVRRFQLLSGASAEDASRFVAVLDDFKIASETGGNALFIFGRNIATGTERLESLGVSVKRNQDGTVNLTEGFLDLADAIARTPSAAERNELAMAALGRQGRELIPILIQGREGLERFFASAEGDFQILTQEQLDKQREFELALDGVADALSGVARAIGSELVPKLTPIIDLFSRAASAVNTALDALGKAEDFIGKIGDEAKERGPIIRGIFEGIRDAARDAAEHLPNIGPFIALQDSLGGADEANRKLAEGAAQAAAALETEAAAAAQAAAAVLDAFAAASAAFDARLDALTPAFGDTFRAEATVAASSGSASASRLADAEEQAAERITDARREVGEVHEETTRAIRDAQRELAEEVEEAAERIADAERDLMEQRLDFRRRIADADRDERRARQDAAESILEAEERVEQIRAQIARRGFATAGDEQALQEALRDAASVRTDANRDIADAQQEAKRAREDAAQSEANAARNVAEVAEENAERIAEARRRLARAHEEAAERIIDAERRLSAAVRDGAKQIAQAQERQISGARKVTKAQQFSVASFRRSLETNIEDLGTFTDAILEIADKTQKIADKDIRQAFLAELTEMGPGAADRLRKLADLSKGELAKLVTLFGVQIAAAKTAADLQFDKFPPNFEKKFGAMLRITGARLGDLIDQFDNVGDKAGPIADALASKINDIGVELGVAADAAGDALPPIARGFLNAANNATNAREKARLYKRFLDELNGTTAVTKLQLLLNLIPDSDFRDTLATVNGNFQLAKNIEINVNGFQAGGHPRVGEMALVGEDGRELIIPDQPSTIFSNPDTERILAALGRPSQQVNHITIEKVADNEEATAFAVAARLGFEATR